MCGGMDARVLRARGRECEAVFQNYQNARTIFKGLQAMARGCSERGNVAGNGRLRPLGPWWRGHAERAGAKVF